MKGRVVISDLNEKREYMDKTKIVKDVRKAYAMPLIAIAFMVMFFVSGGLFHICEAVLGVLVEDEGPAGTWIMDTYLVVVAVYLILFVYFAIAPKIIISRKRWREMFAQIKKGTLNLNGYNTGRMVYGTGKLAGNDAVAFTGAAMMIEDAIGLFVNISAHAESVANVLGIKLPKAQKYVVPIIVMPIVAMLCITTYGCVTAKDTRVQNDKAASATIENLKSEFEKYLSVTYADSIENIPPYQVTGTLDTDKCEASIIAHVSRQGKLINLMYEVTIDCTMSKEEAISIYEDAITGLNRAIKDVDGLPKIYTKLHLPSDKFAETFLSEQKYTDVRIGNQFDFPLANDGINEATMSFTYYAGGEYNNVIVPERGVFRLYISHVKAN